MKHISLQSLIVISLSALFLACGTSGKHDLAVDLQNKEDSVSYALGITVAHALKKEGIDSLDIDLFFRAVEDVYGDSAGLSNEQASQIVASYSQEFFKAKYAQNKKEGEAFLQENKSKPGVVNLPGGLQYMILKEGTGEQPDADSKVVAHVRGSRLDGSEFDNSYKRGKPDKFFLNNVIKAWSEAFQLMSVGSKWRIYVPPNLAYGKKGVEGVIEPNSTLIFDLELLAIDSTTTQNIE